MRPAYFLGALALGPDNDKPECGSFTVAAFRCGEITCIGIGEARSPRRKKIRYQIFYFTSRLIVSTHGKDIDFVIIEWSRPGVLSGYFFQGRVIIMRISLHGGAPNG